LGDWCRSIAIDPVNRQHPLRRHDSGGAFKSVDSGATWISVRAGFNNPVVRTVMIDPCGYIGRLLGNLGGHYQDARTAPQAGISRPTQVLTNTNVTALAMDPNNHSVLYAGTGAGIFKTTNGGSNWSAASNGLNTTFSIGSIAIDRNNSSIIYAASLGAGMFKSPDGGANVERD
jgi:hypothetical protein